ncbi:hypothetical protein GF314_14090 [bacterium]|nr:hypothetical protein [bacterium]
MMRLVSIGLLATLLTLAGCGGDRAPVRTDPVWYDDLIGQPTGARTGWPDAVDCTPMPGVALRGGDLTMALGEEVSPARAPVPSTAAERVVFAGCYETLTRVACTGELAPGLAERWDRLEGGRRWRFHLRQGAVFWDGTPVTATAVMASWSRNLALTDGLGRPCPGLWLEPTGRGMIARTATLLEIRLAEPQDDLPRLLAHPALAVAELREGWVWPVGSGPCRLGADTDLPLPDLVCRPNDHHPEPPRWRSFTFRVLPGTDPRDLLQDGVDLALVRERRALDFYGELGSVRQAPLVWDRKHVLLVPPQLDVSPALGARFAGASATVADGRDTDRLTFRRCREVACPQLHGPTMRVIAPPLDPDPARVVPRLAPVVHDAADPDAAALAARVAALLPERPTVRALPSAAVGRTLQGLDPALVVVRLDACYPSPCLTLAALLAHAHWLQAAVPEADIDACRAARVLLDGGHAIPLADTRAHVVWRGPLAGLELGHDGTPLIATLGVAASAVTP